MGSSSETPEKCTICLAQIENRSVIDECLHAFCYSCLKEWSKVKAVCPLCKQPFTFFMYNIRANDDFDKFQVPLQPSNDFNNHLQRFIRWESETNRVVDHLMSSRIYEWRERIQQDQENARASIVAATSVEIIRRRRRFYREGIQVSHVRNNKQVRDISSNFYRDNPPQIHRLVPWLKRELIVLFGANNMMLVNRVCDLILSAVPTLGIRSSDFYNELKPYLRERTDHFLKEFISYASSPHELTTYDNNARYVPSRHHRTNNVPTWSSDDESSEHPRRFLPPLYNITHPEPPPLAHVRNQVSLERGHARMRQRLQTPQPTMTSSPAIVISSTSSDDSEVEFVKFIKPPHQRTPDAVIALSSDEEIPGPSRRSLPTLPTNQPGSPPRLPNQAQGASSPIDTTLRSDDSDSSDVNVTLRSVVVQVKKQTASWGESSSELSEVGSRSLHDRPHRTRRFSSESSREGARTHKPLRKIFERKRIRCDNDLTLRMPRRWSSSSDSSDDFATPYVSRRRSQASRKSK